MLRLLIAPTLVLVCAAELVAEPPWQVVFDGEFSEHTWALEDLGADWPADWSDYEYLVMELKTSSPQRFSLWIHTTDGKRRLMLQPFGQNVWLRASIPLRYYKGKDQQGNDLASTNNRRTDSFWMSVWGPFGELKAVEALGVTMQYPVGKPTLEIRSVELSNEDRGSEFLEGQQVVDEFGQWVHADWPRKIRSREQLEQERAEEERALEAGGLDLGRYGGYPDTQAEATGFFRVEEIDGKWWFVDPEGHLFLSTGCNCISAGGMRGFGGRGGRRGFGRGRSEGPDLLTRRMDAWGLTTIGNWSMVGQGRQKAYTATLSAPQTGPSYLGLPDVYSEEFARRVDENAARQCAPRADDPWLLGYFVGNEPPWADREGELVDMILAGPQTATQDRLKAFLEAGGDTPERREEFVVEAFQTYLDLLCEALKKHDPNHLNLGIRFGGTPPERVLRTAEVFDVCSINVYEYEPTKQMRRAYEVVGRPILIGEFHFGVPANGLGAGLVQVRDQPERAKGYRYYVEQAAALPCFVGAHWFQWSDEPVTGRFDGENYNIGLVDAADRPYPELIEALKATHERLYDVHAGTVEPFDQRPNASDAGTPDSPWGD